VGNGGELLRRYYSTGVARMIPPTSAEYLGMEEECLVAAGLMRLPLDEKKDDFLDLPAPRVSPDAVRTAIRAERDED